MAARHGVVWCHGVLVSRRDVWCFLDVWKCAYTYKCIQCIPYHQYNRNVWLCWWGYFGWRWWTEKLQAFGGAEADTLRLDWIIHGVEVNTSLPSCHYGQKLRSSCKTCNLLLFFHLNVFIFGFSDSWVGELVNSERQILTALESKTHNVVWLRKSKNSHKS